MTGRPPDLTGAQKAAAVLAQLGDRRAQAVLGAMSEPDVVRLLAEMARLPDLSSGEVAALMSKLIGQVEAQRRVGQGGADRARRWLEDRLGPTRAAIVASGLEAAAMPQPFEFLQAVEPSAIATCLSDEHPQTVALVVANLDREHAARVLATLTVAQATDIVRRMATLGPVQRAIMERLSDALSTRIAALRWDGTGAEGTSGVTAAAAVLNSMERGSERAILSSVESSDPELAEAIRSEMFLFEDVVALDDATLRVVLRSVVLRDVALALKSALPEIVEKFRRNLSDRTAEDLDEEMAGLGAQRISVILEAQTRLIRVVRELGEQDVVHLDRADDELIA